MYNERVFNKRFGVMLKQFRDSIRFHKVRGREFSEVEMDAFKIRGIYNMVGELDYMSPGVVRSFSAGCLRPMSEEVAIIEASFHDRGKRNPLKVVSVMVFRTREAYLIFALKDGLDGPNYKDDDGYAEPILGLLN